MRELRNLHERELAEDVANRESRADAPIHRASPETPLARVETSGEGQHSEPREIDHSAPPLREPCAAMREAMAALFPQVPIEVEAGVCRNWGDKP